MKFDNGNDNVCVFNICQHFEISISRNTNKPVTLGVYITINDNYSSDWHLCEVSPRCNGKLTPSDMIIIRGYIKRPVYKYASNSALTTRYIVRERRTHFVSFFFSIY
jgi:hypothetical protein